MTERLRVLVVEDNPGDARLVEHLLSLVPDVDFDLEVQTTLEDAVRRVRLGGLDVALLDPSLPDSDAEQSLLRLQAAAPDLPMVVLTGRQDRELALQAMRAGAHDVVAKRGLETDRLCRALVFAVERQMWHRTVQRLEQRYALAFAGADDGLWDWRTDLDTVYYSPRWKGMLGYGEEEIGDRLKDWLDRVHPDDRGAVQKALDEHRAGNSQSISSEHRISQKNGEYRWVLVRGRSVRTGIESVRRIVGSLTDIHERKLNEERLRHDAFHDGLTGLANAALLRDRLMVSIAHIHRRDSYQFAVIYLDLDRFKRINDSLGHAAGDQVLVALANRLKPVLRPGDTLARLGGDEFAILADDLDDPRDAKRLAARIRRVLEAPYEIDGRKVVCGASMGITMSSRGYQRPEDVLRDADAAMYRAKAQGRGQQRIFDEAMNESAETRLQLEAELRQAIEKAEFRLHYQPIVRLETGQIEGFEALLRWLHPKRGLVYPKDFIQIAEETGLIVPLGLHVLDEACRQMAIWNHRYRASRLVMSVNLSPRQFREEDLVASLTQILQTSGLPPECLRLEIGERPLIENGEASLLQLRRLAELGVKVSIDDFGSALSFIGHLRQVPAEAIKIDRALLERVRSEGGWSLVESLMGMARTLGMRTTAEGLETAEQVERLRELNCESVQGYYFSAPLDGAGAEALLAYREP